MSEAFDYYHRESPMIKPGDALLLGEDGSAKFLEIKTVELYNGQFGYGKEYDTTVRFVDGGVIHLFPGGWIRARLKG